MNRSNLGNRIKTYRLTAGLSLRELSKRVPVSPQALSQYETGRIHPSEEMLVALAHALGTNTNQFLDVPEHSLLKSIEISLSASSKPRVHDAILSSTVYLMNQYLDIERKVGGTLPSPSVPFLDRIATIQDCEDVEAIAHYVRHKWSLGTGPLPRLVALFEARGVRVLDWKPIDESDEFRSCFAFVSTSEGSEARVPVILLNSIMSGEQKRFSLCQELGHLILPSSMRTAMSVQKRERFADWFAGSVLLPTSALHDQLGRRRTSISWYELTEVKKQFGIGYTQIAHRIHQVGIISRRMLDDLVRNFKRLGWTKPPYQEHLALPADSESSSRLKRLTLRALAEGVVTRQHAARLLDVDTRGIT